MTHKRMTATDYETNSVELSHFTFVFVADEKEKYQLFQNGLHLEIKAKMKMHNYGSFAELVEGVIKAEKIEEEFYNQK